MALVALLVALSVFGTLTAPGTSPGQRWTALAFGVLQALPVLWRRSHPGLALAVYSATKPVQYAAMLPVSEWPWLVLVYSLFAHRPPRVAASVLAPTLLATCLVSAAAISVARDVGFLGVLVGLALVVSVQMVVAAGLGWAARATRARAIRRRELADQARLATAIGRERERIAAELNSVVAARLKRVVARTEQLREQLAQSPRSAHQMLSDVHGEARQALAAMRRTLGFLRSEHSAPDQEPAPRTARRWAPPGPTLSGIGLVGAFAAATLLLHTTLPARPPANELAEIWPSLFLQPERPWSLVLLLIQLAALGWWRSAPLCALAVGTLATSAALLLQADHFLATISWMLLVYAAGAGAAPVASALVIAGATVSWLAAYQLGGRYPSARGELASVYLLMSGVLMSILWAVGALHRRAAQRTRQHTDDQAERDVRAALSQERNRIARELHDVLAQNVSAIMVQAAAARGVAGSEPAVVRDAIGHIEDSGRRTLDALPTLLELQPGPAAVTAPVRLDAGGVERLVAPLRSAGLPMTVEIHGEAGDRHDEVELFAQRILMEALTNVLRHAGPTPTHVRLDSRPDAVTIEVTDAGAVAGHQSAQDGGGHGLIGMRERAELLGGTLTAGPHGERGWQMRTRLPRPPAS